VTYQDLIYDKKVVPPEQPGQAFMGKK